MTQSASGCASDGLVTVGKVVRPHGLKGVVKMLSYSDDPTRLEDVRRVILTKGEPAARTVEVVTCRKDRVLLKLQGIDDHDAAESLRGAEVQVREEDLPPLEEGEFYAHDLVGLEVLSAEGEVLGRLVEVMSLPGQDLYVVEMGDRRVMIPAVGEIVKDLDLRAGRLVVAPPPGLLDL